MWTTVSNHCGVMSDQKIANIVVFASGRGSNFHAVHRVLQDMPEAPARIVLCVSNNPSPGAFDYARDHDIKTERLSPKMFPDNPDQYQKALLQLLDEHNASLLLLAGYMRKLPPEVVSRYRGKILNVHPGLLPDFGGQGMYGMNVHRAVIKSGATESGATVHLADEEYDTGPVIAQQNVPVFPDDTPETLAERVLSAEHALLPRVVIHAAKRIINGMQIEPMNEQ